MPTADSRSLRTLHWAARIAAALLLVFALLFSWLMWRAQKAEEIEQLKSILTLGEKAIDTYFSGLAVDLKGLSLAARGADGAIDPTLARGAMKSYQALHPEIVTITLVRADGQILLSSNSPADRRLPSVSGDPSFEASLEELQRGRSLSIGRPRFGEMSRIWVAPIRYAIRKRSGDLDCYFSAALPVGFLQTFWQDAPVTGYASIGLIRDDGYLLSRHPVDHNIPPEKLYGQPRKGALVQLLRQGQPPVKGEIEGLSLLDGPPSLFVFQRLQHYPVTLYAVMPTAHLWEAWWEKVWAPYLLLLLVTGGGFAAYRVAARRQSAWDAEQRRATEALRESQLQLQTVIDSLPQSVYLRDLDGRFQLVNTAAAGRFRTLPAALIGRKSADLPWGDPDAVRRLTEGDRKLLETGEAAVVPNFRRVLPGGEERWFHVVKVPLLNATGLIKGLLTVSEDITERKLAEERLRASERLLQTVFDTIPHVVVVKDQDSRYLMVNQAWYDVFGLSPSQVIRKHTGEILGRPEGEVAALLEHDRIVLSGSADKVISEDLVSVGGGERRFLHTTKRPLRDGSGAIAGLVAVSVDVTAERAAEEKLRASERLMRTVLDTIPHVVIVKDTESRYLMVNRAWSTLFGLDSEHVLHKHIRQGPPGIREEADRFLETDRIVLSGSRESFAFDHEVTGKDGGRHFMHTVKRPFRGANGTIAGLVMISVDMTAEKVAEEKLRASEQALQQVQKMEALGALTSGVAHEFNNTLQIISGYVELVMSEFGEGHPSLPDVLEIKKGVLRSSALTRQLLAFSREHGFQPEAVDLTALAQDARQLLGTLVAANIDLRVKADKGVNRVLADRGMIEQVLVNLAVNARDAMPSGGRMEIEVGQVDCDEAFCSRNTWAQPGRYGTLRFSDTGAGIAPEMMERIFEPFFTTKEPGKGTGLGLSTVYGIVKQHRGMIRVESAPNAGTTFRIYLPAV